jgi:hypothetical protein
MVKKIRLFLIILFLILILIVALFFIFYDKIYFNIPPKIESSLSLNVSGKLIDILPDNRLIILKIQPETVNGKSNNTLLEINVNQSAFKEYKKEISNYSRKVYDYNEENVALRYWYSSGNSYYIYDINDLEPGIFYYFNFNTYEQGGGVFSDYIFGQFVNYNETKNSISLYIIVNNEEGPNTIYLTDNKEFEWENVENVSATPRNKEFMLAQRPWRLSDLKIDNNYLFILSQSSLEEDNIWDYLFISKI